MRLTFYTSPGVIWMQDPRTGTYNFDPWISTVPSVKDFAFERVAGFISSAEDNVSQPLFHWRGVFIAIRRIFGL